MNNNTKYLLIAGAAVALWIANKAKKYYEQLQVRFAGFQINELMLTGNTTATFTIDFYNPTPVALTINSLMGDLYINNSFIGTLHNYNEQIVSAYSASRLEATISVPTVSLASRLVNILSNNTTEQYSIRYNGFMVVEGVRLKLDFVTNL